MMAQGTLPWQPILGPKWAKIGRFIFICRLRIPKWLEILQIVILKEKIHL